MSTSAQLPLCVYCGTERPADQSRCTTCGKTWIDIRVGAGQEIPVTAAVGAGISAAGSGTLPAAPPSVSAGLSDDGDSYFEDWDPWAAPPRNTRHEKRWLIPGILAAAVIIVYGLIFFGFLDGSDESAATTAPPAAPATTGAPNTTDAPSTTAVPAPTTTAAPTTTTTTTTVPAPTAFTATGDPVALNRFRLSSSALGPVAFGISVEEATGILVASLGTADESGVAGEELGLCETESGFWLRWAELTVVFSGTSDSGTFVSYRHATPAGPATSHIDLQTPSGIRLGDSIADLESTYDQFAIAYEVVDGKDFFALREGEELLLWGPISSTEPSGRIEGIFSPDSCA